MKQAIFTLEEQFLYPDEVQRAQAFCAIVDNFLCAEQSQEEVYP